MQLALRDAMKARDRVAMAALRTALAAIANAEAVPIDAAPTDVYGELVEHERQVLAESDVVRIVQHQIDDRRATAAQVAAHGRTDEAAVLTAEADVLAGILGPN